MSHLTHYEWQTAQDKYSQQTECCQYNLVSMLNPKIFIDGNQWCVLFGENLQDGVAGFGLSPEDAALDFNDAWRRKLTEVDNEKQ